MEIKTKYNLIKRYFTKKDRAAAYRLVYTETQDIKVGIHAYHVEEGEFGPIVESPLSFANAGNFYIDNSTYVPKEVVLGDNVAIIKSRFGGTDHTIKISGSFINNSKLDCAGKDTIITDSQIVDAIVSDSSIILSKLNTVNIDTCKAENSTLSECKAIGTTWKKSVSSDSAFSDSSFVESVANASVVAGSTIENSVLREVSIDSATIICCQVRKKKKPFKIYGIKIEGSVVESAFPVFANDGSACVSDAVIKTLFDACIIGDRFYWRTSKNDDIVEFASGIRNPYTYISSTYTEGVAENVTLYHRSNLTDDVSKLLHNNKSILSSDFLNLLIKASEKSDFKITPLAQKLYVQIITDWMVDQIEHCPDSSQTKLIKEKITPLLSVDISAKKLIGSVKVIDQKTISLMERFLGLDRNKSENILKNDGVVVIQEA